MLNYDQETIELCKKRIKELLINGEVSRTVVKTSSETVKFDECDQVIGRTENYRTVQTTNIKSVPSWILNNIIESIDTEKAIQLLQSRGYVIIDPTMKDGSEINKGISAETVSIIEKVLYGELLGIKALPESQEIKE